VKKGEQTNSQRTEQYKSRGGKRNDNINYDVGALGGWGEAD